MIPPPPALATIGMGMGTIDVLIVGGVMGASGTRFDLRIYPQSRC